MFIRAADVNTFPIYSGIYSYRHESSMANWMKKTQDMSRNIRLLRPEPAFRAG